MILRQFISVFCFRTSVRLGEWNISSPNDCSDPTNCADPPLDIKVEKIIPYPSYRDAVVLGDDISLIKLERDVEYTGNTARAYRLMWV